jgi:hypothetical protein
MHKPMGMSKQRVATSSAVGLLCSDTFRAPGEWEGLGVVLFFVFNRTIKGHGIGEATGSNPFVFGGHEYAFLGCAIIVLVIGHVERRAKMVGYVLGALLQSIETHVKDASGF